MNLWSRWFGTRVTTDRWVVLDVETTGLDPYADELLAVAALGVRCTAAGPVLCPGDSFEVVLQPQSRVASHDNILLHGIGLGQQRAGLPADEALAALRTWLGAAPLLAWHAGFDRAFLQRATARHLGAALSSPWLDLADLADLAFPEVRSRSLDALLELCHIECAQRHNAAADVKASAELWQVIWARLAPSQRRMDWPALVRLANQAAWLRKAGSGAGMAGR